MTNTNKQPRIDKILEIGVQSLQEIKKDLEQNLQSSNKEKESKSFMELESDYIRLLHFVLSLNLTHEQIKKLTNTINITEEEYYENKENFNEYDDDTSEPNKVCNYDDVFNSYEQMNEELDIYMKFYHKVMDMVQDIQEEYIKALHDDNINFNKINDRIILFHDFLINLNIDSHDRWDEYFA